MTVRRWKAVLWAVGLAPLVWMLWRLGPGDGLGANPIEAVTHVSGRWALAFLMATLAVTPARWWTGINALIKVRRLLGLWAFAWVTLHFGTYLFDQVFGWPLAQAWTFVLEDIAERPYITAGFTAFVLLVPLAVTSTRGWIRRLGRRWQGLHRLVYAAAALAVLHYYWKVKADALWPLLAALLLAALLTARVLRWRRKASRRREPLSKRAV